MDLYKNINDSGLVMKSRVFQSQGVAGRRDIVGQAFGKRETLGSGGDLDRSDR